MEKRENHSPDFKAKVVLEVMREAMTLSKMPKTNGVHPTHIGRWKRAAIDSTATAFMRLGAAQEQVSAAEIDELHPKIGQLVVERLFLMPRTNCSGRGVPPLRWSSNWDMIVPFSGG